MSRPVPALRWTVLDADDALKRAVCRVTRSSTEFVPTRGANDEPLPENNRAAWEGTLCDRRMGPADPREICETCGQMYPACLGHWGVIVLNEPVMPSHFAPHVKRIISTACVDCFAPRRSDPCETCGAPAASISWNAARNVFVATRRFSGESCKTDLDSANVVAMLRQQGRGDERMFMETIAVVPTCARPYRPSPRGTECDHLTTLYAHVVAANDAMKEKDIPSFRRDALVRALREAVNTLCSDESGDGNGGITERLKGKEGRLRGNLMGGTTFFSARAVVTGAPELRADQIGVPFDIARTLTVPERVFEGNLQEVRRWLLNDVVTRAEVADFTREVTPHNRSRILELLRVGDVVHRRLRHGDVVLVNRQPSLHRHSMMALSVVIVPFKTMRLNPVLCQAYNADFDGDEMNFFVPQTLDARAEAQELMFVPENVISSQTALPTMGLIMDSVLACFMLSAARLSRDAAMQFLNQAQLIELPPPTFMTPRQSPEWSGYALLSELLPSKLNYKGHGVVVRNGCIVEGVLTKSVVGATSGSLLDVMAKTCGTRAVVDFLSNVQPALNWWLSTHGFSVSLSDAKVQAAQRDALVTQSTRLPDMNPLQMGTHRDKLGEQAMKKLDAGDSMVQMIAARSKGTKTNLLSMVLAVGTQIIDGQLPPSVDGRALPYFSVRDRTAAARGFVSRNFRLGLSVPETLFCAQWGRGSTVDTSEKTRVVGYVSRKLMRTLEDCVVAYDGTVRAQNNRIIQFAYGGTGFAIEKLFHVILPLGSSPDACEQCELDACAHWLVSPVLLPFYPPDLVTLGDVGEVSCSLSPRDILMETRPLPSAPESVCAAYVHFLSSGAVMSRCWTLESLRAVVSRVRSLIADALVSPGEPVGCRAAHGIGQPSTQMTLNTFHHNGVSFAAVSGQRRVTEILHATRKDKTPIMRLTTPQGTMVATTLTRVCIGDLVERSRVVVRDHTYDPPMWEQLYNAARWREIPKKNEATHIIELQLNDAHLRSTNVRMRDVCEVLKHMPTVEDVTRSHESTSGGKRLDGLCLIHAFVRAPKPYRILSEMMRVTIKGRSAFGAWSNVTPGAAEVACASGKAAQDCFWDSWLFDEEVVDHGRTQCSSVFATFRACGIEAARECIIRELRKTFETDGGSMVAAAHLALLADTMCFTGVPLGIHSMGVSTEASSTLARACYERVVETVAAAAVANTHEAIHDVASRVATGQCAPLGTNASFETVLDEEACRCALEQIAETNVSSVLDEGEDRAAPDWTGHEEMEYVESQHHETYAPGTPDYAPGTPDYAPGTPAYAPGTPDYEPGTPTGDKLVVKRVQTMEKEEDWSSGTWLEELCEGSWGAARA